MNKDKSGCKLEGITAINPANGKEVDIYIGDFVDKNQRIDKLGYFIFNNCSKS